ncbi:hypothetical protein GQR58_019815 [Nymphon striatum]|nr:hypothetical protein GQR58_019815 [Nymphon striatum]
MAELPTQQVQRINSSDNRKGNLGIAHAVGVERAAKKLLSILEQKYSQNEITSSCKQCKELLMLWELCKSEVASDVCCNILFNLVQSKRADIQYIIDGLLNIVSVSKSRVLSFVYLEIVFTPQLSFTKHIERCVSKANARLGLLFSSIPLKSLFLVVALQLFSRYILPIFHYCIHNWLSKCSQSAIGWINAVFNFFVFLNRNHNAVISTIGKLFCILCKSKEIEDNECLAANFTESSVPNPFMKVLQTVPQYWPLTSTLTEVTDFEFELSAVINSIHNSGHNNDLFLVMVCKLMALYSQNVLQEALTIGEILLSDSQKFNSSVGCMWIFPLLQILISKNASMSHSTATVCAKRLLKLLEKKLDQKNNLIAESGIVFCGSEVAVNIHIETCTFVKKLCMNDFDSIIKSMDELEKLLDEAKTISELLPNIICSVMLHHLDHIEIVTKCLKCFAKYAVLTTNHTPGILPFLLYSLNRSVIPEVRLEILKTLPSLVHHKHNCAHGGAKANSASTSCTLDSGTK